MNCLSVRQPWALLVCVGTKTIENRSWTTTFRGLIAVHAGMSTKGVDSLLTVEGMYPSLTKDLFVFGAIIGVAELYDVLPFSGQLRDDPWAEGPYCFMLRNSRLFAEPIVHKGRVGLCKLRDDESVVVASRIATSSDTNAEARIKASVQAIPHGPISRKLLRSSDRPSRM